MTHDAYIAAAPEPMRAVLSRLRARLAEALPDAEEVLKYDMPGFRVGTEIVAGYAAFSRQCGLYVDPRAIAALSDRIAQAKLKATKTGITFPPDKPIPDDLITGLALESRRRKGL
jgi:uncharacterized protein YdhG (YjbR/CyaY superfamily)